MNTATKVWMSVLLLAVGGYAAYAGYRAYRASETTSASRGTGVAQEVPVVPVEAKDWRDFKFTDTEGKPFSLAELEGKVWACSFFFASCPGNCTQMNLAIAGMQKELAAELPDIEVPFLSITVDPENDPPERLATYAKTFEADPKKWKFLTGPFTDAERLGNVFKVLVVPRDHSSRVVLVGSDGHVHGAYAATDPTQMVLLKKKILELAKGEATTEPARDASEGAAPAAADQKTAAAPAD